MNKKIIGTIILFSLALVYFQYRDHKNVVVESGKQSIPKIEVKRIQSEHVSLTPIEQVTSPVVENKVENKIEIPQTKYLPTQNIKLI